MCVSVRACRYWHASPWATPNCLFSPLQLARAAGMARCGGPGSLLRTVVVASVCTQGTHGAHRPGSHPCWGTTRFSHVWPAAGVHLWLGQRQNSLCGDGEMILKTTEKKKRGAKWCSGWQMPLAASACHVRSTGHRPPEDSGCGGAPFCSGYLAAERSAACRWWHPGPLCSSGPAVGFGPAPSLLVLVSHAGFQL